jgi:WD40 repeat protein
MRPWRVASLLLGLLLLGSIGWSQETLLPPVEKTPLLQFDVDGPTAAVNALALRKDKDGETLFAAGLDKVVRVWQIKDGTVTRQGSYRVPIGPGNAGVINTLAVSDDSTWLAVAGRGLMRGETNFQASGVVIPQDALSEEMLRDLGNIYLMDLTKPPGSGGKVLRGHTGAVKALAFAPSETGKKNVLVSTAVERSKGKSAGAVLVWDVEQAASVARLDRQLPATPAQPGLVVRRVGSGPRDVRIALAWPEASGAGSLRIWDAGATGKDAVRLWREGERNSTVAGIGKDRLLTGYLLNRSPRLRLYRLTGGVGDARLSTDEDVEVPHPDEVYYLPVDMATLTDSHVAVLHRPSQQRESYLLTVYDVSGKTPVRKGGFALPCSVEDEVPVLAAVPGGRYLAIANYDSQYTIRLFAIRDLLQGRGEPVAGLRIPSAATAARQVAFVTRAGKPGLWLGDDASARVLEGGRLFDLEGRTLGTDFAGWSQDQADPNATGWVAKQGGNDRLRTISRGDQTFSIALGKDQDVTAVALRPPGGVVKQAVLAVAHLDTLSNEAFISLFDVATGKPFMRLNGHLQRINHLAFSSSLPLLASVAGDQTVCVWGLRDLDKASGTIEGLELRDEKNNVVVHRVESGSPANEAGIKKGDVIQGLGPPGGPAQPVKSAMAFYLDLAGRKPSTKEASSRVAVKVNDKTVTLPVSRAVEERKPLFSLFLPRGGGWLGWSPLGFYDASGPEAEKLLGWHTNTGQGTAPVAFARLEMYRKTFYREGVLADLAAGKPLAQARVIPPDLLARIRDADLDPNTPSLYIVRQRQAVLEIEVDADYEVHDKDRQTWQVVGPDGRPFPVPALKLARDRRWQAELKDIDWKPGDYRITASYYSEQIDKTVTRDLTLRYLPPPPVLTVRIGQHEFTKDLPQDQRRYAVKDEEVKDGKLPVAVEAKSAAGDDQEFSVQLLHRAPEKTLAVVKDGKGRLQVALSHQLPLAAGVHTLRVYAGPKKTDVRGDEDIASQFDIEVVFKPRPQKVDITDLRIAPEGERRTSMDLPDVKGVPVAFQLVEKPDITLHAQIEGTDALAQLDLIIDPDKPESLPRDRTAKRATVEKTLSLPMNKPRRLAIQAKTERSTLVEKEIWVVYSPTLPVPIGQQYTERTNQPEVSLKGKLQVPASGLKYDVALLVTDESGKEKTIREIKVSAGTTGGEETWEKSVQLAPGENRIRLLLKNDWRRSEGEPFRIRYVRPPEILAAPKVIQVEKSPLIEITASVKTPAELPPTQVTVNETVHPFSWVPQQKVGAQTVGQLTIKDVPVNGKEPGITWLKQVQLVVSNQDGVCEKPAVVEIKPPDKGGPGAPARVSFLNIPSEGTQTHQKQFPVRVLISSESPLKSVQLYRHLLGPDGQSLDQLLGKADLSNAKGGLPSTREDSIPASLDRGVNHLILAVKNEGHGEHRIKVPPIVYVVPAPRVVIDRIEPLNVQGQPLPLDRQDGRLRLPATMYSLLMLHGSVEWDDVQDGALADPAQEIQIVVNAMRQFPVALAPIQTGTSRKRRTFQTPIALTREKDNVVELKPANLPNQVEGDTVVHLDCTNPMKDQRLHVLIVGVDVDDAERLKQSFFQAFGVTKPPAGLRGAFNKEPFKQAYLYHVVARRDATRETILAQMKWIESEIEKQQRSSKWVNDVIFLYYQGSRVYNANTCYLETKLNRIDKSAPVERYALDCRKLPTLPGVQLLLLNANEKGTKTASAQPLVNDPLTGVISYANLKGEEKSDTPTPKFLALWEKAWKQTREGRLSEVVNLLDKLREQGEELQKFNLPVLSAVVIGPPPPPQK